MKTMTKKLVTLAALSLFSIGAVQVAQAATYSKGPKWARNTEHYQLSYHGEAYTVAGRGPTKVAYYRNGAYVGGATANAWDTRDDYKDVWVSDSWNPWGAKTQFYYNF